MNFYLHRGIDDIKGPDRRNLTGGALRSNRDNGTVRVLADPEDLNDKHVSPYRVLEIPLAAGPS